MIAGQRQGRCLDLHPSSLKMSAVQAEVAALFAQLDTIPRVLQTDRHACFLGAEEPGCKAVPSRFTLWLVGQGIGHRLIPVRRPQHNGAVERFHGGLKQSVRDEPDGEAAFITVWNLDRPPLSPRHRRYRGRQGFQLRRVWALLAQTEVQRRVSRQGTISLWDRPVWVGTKAAGQTVRVRFEAATRHVVIVDAHEQRLRTAPLPWLTADWLWAPVHPTDLSAHSSDPATCR